MFVYKPPAKEADLAPIVAVKCRQRWDANFGSISGLSLFLQPVLLDARSAMLLAEAAVELLQDSITWTLLSGRQRNVGLHLWGSFEGTDAMLVLADNNQSNRNRGYTLEIRKARFLVAMARCDLDEEPTSVGRILRLRIPAACDPHNGQDAQ